eukprot:CAMPEP_0195299724 /NCGR_PEP_ID=MMETSP0707-20130614/26075_1 /TAXON_ID=33640 /ORGANISM="Asterionellopsis glacialis, Strain CCMP134" /LENGTH=600 /DNA_ID=CAMNT_0040362203 /DNA_START=52 /DNA_END=1854 /DNA_ORIENTATION=+
MPLCTAISEDGSTVALVTSPRIIGSRLTIPLYQVASSGTSSLQSTLAASISSYGLSTSEEDEQNETILTQMCFASQDKLLCALVNHKVALVWDISRGVVAYHIKQGDSDDESTILNVHATANHVYALVLSSPDKKLCVHQYEATSGKLVKKLKCGKLSQDDHDATSSSSSCGMTVTSDDATVAIRNGNLIRLYQLDDGSKVGKCKLKENGTSSGRALVAFANDNTLVATSMGSGIMFFTTKAQKLVGTIYVEGNDGSCDNLVISKKGDDSVYNVVVQTSSSGALYSLDLSKASKKTVLKPHTKISPQLGGDKVALSLLSSPVQPTVVAAMYDYQRRLTHLQNIHDEGSEDLKLSFPEDESKDEGEDGAEPSSVQDQQQQDGKKRKTTKNATVLGPGQAGGEAVQMTDRPVSKRAKVSDDEDDFDDDDEEEDGDGDKEQSIAERLQRLAQEMQGSDDEDDEDNEGATTKVDFNPKKATTESLSHLLKQALTSGDDSMLELALGVRNKGILQVTLASLEASHIALLLTKLTSRLASKPTRAEELSVWLQFVLMSEKLQEVVASGGTSDHNLRPLRNLLQERTESFPHLLRLDGRLSLMGHSS